MNALHILIIVLFMLIFSSNFAYAYLDPGSGSFLLQMLLAGLLAAGFFIKSTWYRIKSFFVGLFAKKSDGKK